MRFIKCAFRLWSPLMSYSGLRAQHSSAVNFSDPKLKANKARRIKTNPIFARYEAEMEYNEDYKPSFFRRAPMFMHSIFESNPKYSKSTLQPAYFTDLLVNIPDTHLNFDEDLTKLPPDSVLPYMATLTRNLMDNKLQCSSPAVVQFACYIKNNVIKLRRDDIPKILALIYHWPLKNKLSSNSSSDIIFALDHACATWAVDFKRASVEEILLWMEPWYFLTLCTMSEFVQAATGRLFWRADKPEHIVQLLFYMSELRTLPDHYDRPSIEKKVIRYMRYFDCDEIGILATGFYKSCTKVTNYVLYKKLVKRIVSETDKFHEISLNAVLKLLRLTFLTFREASDVLDIQEALTPLVPRMAGFCLVQTAMLGTAVEIIKPDLMKTLMNMVCQKMDQLREKDIQRFMYACAMGAEETDVEKFVHHVVNEIYERKLTSFCHMEGINDNILFYKVSVSFIEIVLFLHILGHKSSELIASAIEAGRGLKVPPRETAALLYLDVIIELLFPDYSGPRLGDVERRHHHQYWFSNGSLVNPARHWFSFEWCETTSEMLRRFYLDVCDACGGAKNVACKTLLPMYEHRDLVVCTDNDGNFVPLPPEFGSEPPHDVKYPINTKDGTYCALVLLRDRSKRGMADHTFYQKLRILLLRKLGYRIAMVRYKVFEDIPLEEKYAYIREVIKKAE